MKFLPVKQSCSSNSTAKLCSDVHSSSQWRYEASNEASYSHSRVYVSACKALDMLISLWCQKKGEQKIQS